MNPRRSVTGMRTGAVSEQAGQKAHTVISVRIQTWFRTFVVCIAKIYMYGN